MSWIWERQGYNQRARVCVASDADTVTLDYERTPTEWAMEVMPDELRELDRQQLHEKYRPAVHWTGEVSGAGWAVDWRKLAARQLVSATSGPIVVIESRDGQRQGTPPRDELLDWRWRVDELDRRARSERGMPLGEGPLRVAQVHGPDRAPEVELFVASFEPRTRRVSLDGFVDTRLRCRVWLERGEAEALRRRVIEERKWLVFPGWADFPAEAGIYVDPGLAGWVGLPVPSELCDDRLARERCARAQAEREALISYLRHKLEGCG